MTLVKCPNGHYYDASRFGNNCPHCGMSAGENINGDQTTVPLNVTGLSNSSTVTEPLNSPAASPVAAPVTAPAKADVTIDNDKTLPVTADMLDGMMERPAPVVGWLVCTEGVNKGTDYRLHQGRNFIGRAAEMDVCIKGDNTVSRSSHAVIVYDPRGNLYLAQPGDSKELLYINDALVLNPVELKAMDVLSVGNTKLMFVPLCGETFRW